MKMKCEDAWAQLNRLDDIRQKLEIDLQDKTEALRIDMDQIELTERSGGLSHKPDPTKVRCLFSIYYLRKSKYVVNRNRYLGIQKLVLTLFSFLFDID